MYHLSVPILLLHIWFPAFIGEMVPNSFLVEDKGILSAGKYLKAEVVLGR